MTKLDRRASRFAILLFAMAPMMHASLLLNASGGTSLGFASDSDDDAISRDLGGTFSLFGTGITKINVATNGFIGTGDLAGIFRDNSVGDLADASGGSVVAGFYDDLKFGNGTTVTDNITDAYYAVTYQSIYGSSDLSSGRTSNFQIVLFKQDAVVNGFHFLAGDIAMSYGILNSVIDGDNNPKTFTVGVGQSSSNSTGTPAASNGVLGDFNSLPSGDQFFLYRPVTETVGEDSRTIYDVSVESTAAPEPAALLLVGLGLTGLGVFKRRK